MSPRARGRIPDPERERLRAAQRASAAAAAELHAAVHAAHHAGGSIREIAHELGMSTNTIQRWIDRDHPGNTRRARSHRRPH